MEGWLKDEEAIGAWLVGKLERVHIVFLPDDGVIEDWQLRMGAVIAGVAVAECMVVEELSDTVDVAAAVAGVEELGIADSGFLEWGQVGGNMTLAEGQRELGSEETG